MKITSCLIQEGQKLPKGEELQKCVKCKAPAKVQTSQHRAVCSRESCGYDYCTRCHLSFHQKPRDCPVLKPRTRQGAGIFSSKCKKSLRRLWPLLPVVSRVLTVAWSIRRGLHYCSVWVVLNEFFHKCCSCLMYCNLLNTCSYQILFIMWALAGLSVTDVDRSSE